MVARRPAQEQGHDQDLQALPGRQPRQGAGLRGVRDRVRGREARRSRRPRAGRRRAGRDRRGRPGEAQARRAAAVPVEAGPRRLRQAARLQARMGLACLEGPAGEPEAVAGARRGPGTGLPEEVRMLIDDVLNSETVKRFTAEQFPRLREDLLQGHAVRSLGAVRSCRGRHPQTQSRSGMEGTESRKAALQEYVDRDGWCHSGPGSTESTWPARFRECNVSIPRRVGCLFHVAPNAPHDVFSMTLFWSAPDDARHEGAMMCVLQCMADFSEQREPSRLQSSSSFPTTPNRKACGTCGRSQTCISART